jgi:hypothetical protein
MIQTWEPHQMPISQTGLLAEILSGGSAPLTGDPIPSGMLAYFRERLKGRVFSLIVSAIREQQEEHPELTQAAIARRLGRRPEQITRWMAGPSNMTLDTISDLVLAVGGGEPSVVIDPLESASQKTDVEAILSDVVSDIALTAYLNSAFLQERQTYLSAANEAEKTSGNTNNKAAPMLAARGMAA